MVTASKDEVLGEIAGADGILFGTPTILQEALNPIWDLTINMYPPVHNGKYAAAFGSYGWSGEAVPHLTERLKQLGLKVMEGLRVRLKPDERDLIDAYDFGCGSVTLCRKRTSQSHRRHRIREVHGLRRRFRRICHYLPRPAA